MPCIVAIDPGNTHSAVCVMDAETYAPLIHFKLPNRDVVTFLRTKVSGRAPVIIERVASYGMAVGKEVFDTCFWIGYFAAVAELNGSPERVHYIYRQEEKLCLCQDSRATDQNIRRALIDRFAVHDLKNGRGVKKNPDFFYGFAQDHWAAFAVGCTWLDKQNGRFSSPIKS